MRNPLISGFVILLAGLNPAQALGGFWCAAEDQNLKFSVRAAEPRAGGHPFNFESTLEVLDPKAPAEFRAFRFTLDDLSDHWHDGRAGGSIKLRFIREGADGQSFGKAELIIDAPRLDEAVYKGGYSLTVYPAGSNAIEDAFKLNGFASCSDD